MNKELLTGEELALIMVRLFSIIEIHPETEQDELTYRKCSVFNASQIIKDKYRQGIISAFECDCSLDILQCYKEDLERGTPQIVEINENL